MRSLSAREIIDIWEAALNQHPLDRALTILSAVCPEMTREQLGELTIGKRDELLLELREKSFGSELKCFATCPGCSEHMEFAMSTTHFRTLIKPGPVTGKKSLELPAVELKLDFRLPNSFDCAAAANCKDVETACSLLIQRCLLEAMSQGQKTDINDLSPEVINALTSYMAECEPLADILIDSLCPACTHKWKMVFDILSYLWKEISVCAKRVLQEVHTLAFAYKWKEEDVLAMTPVRRKFYMEMVT